MAFPRRLLIPGEQVLLEERPHWKALVGPAFVTLVTAGLTGFLYVKANGDGRGVLRIALVAFASIEWIILAGVSLTRWRFTEYILTDHRLMVRTGVFARRAKEIPLETINDITLSQTILGRVLGAGDLILESAGEHGQETLGNVWHPAELQREIYAASASRKSASGAGHGSVADELAKLAALRDRGVLTPEEFEARKRRLLQS
jgi:uncharacterized membrane protein YdbT with pleckstrin-like domain